MEADDLRRLARKTGFDLATLEKDYAITWLLNGLYSQDSKLRELLIFKGGTAIRKVYSPEWRLSEDLDFTIIQEIPPHRFREGFEEALSLLNERGDLTYSIDSFAASTHAVLADVQFMGPLRFKNRIAHDISLREKLVEDPEWRTVRTQYDIPEFEVQIYSLNEITVEKIRSIIQRGKARDYYDTWRLMKEKKLNPKKIRELLIKKCKLTGIEFKPQLIFDETRIHEAQKFWTVSLTRLTRDLPDFDVVITELKDLLSQLPA